MITLAQLYVDAYIDADQADAEAQIPLADRDWTPTKRLVEVEILMRRIMAHAFKGDRVPVALIYEAMHHLAALELAQVNAEMIRVDTRDEEAS